MTSDRSIVPASSVTRVIGMAFALASVLSASPAPAHADYAGCPPSMALIEGFCIDRYEARIVGQSPYEIPTGGVAESLPGVVPQGYIDGNVAAAACANAGKRLCTITEWRRACRGPSTTIYPYGDSYVAGACNDTRPVHPVIELFGPDATFSNAELTDPRLNQLPDTVDPTGSNPACVTAEGVYDMHGNLDEWTSDPSGTFVGGDYVEAYLNGAGCLYTTTAHATSHADYSTGFRCCGETVLLPSIPTTGPAGPWILTGTFAAVALMAAGGTRLVGRRPGP